MKIFSFLSAPKSLLPYAKTILKKIEKPAVVYPKRPVSAYILFSSRKIRQELKDSLESDAKTKFRNAASKASKEWSEMSDEEKKPFIEEYEKSKQDYSQNLKIYMANRTSADAYLENQAWSFKKLAGKITQKPPVDKNKPVKPLSPYFKFSTAARSNPSLYGLESLSNIPVTEQASILGRAWRELESSKKQLFLQKYQAEMKVFKKEMLDYDSEIQQVKDSVKEVGRIVKKGKVVKKKVKKSIPIKKKKVVKKIIKKKTLKKKASKTRKALKPKKSNQ